MVEKGKLENLDRDHIDEYTNLTVYHIVFGAGVVTGYVPHHFTTTVTVEFERGPYQLALPDKELFFVPGVTLNP